MAYSHTTFAQLKQLLANRLGDSSKVTWTDVPDQPLQSELGLYINESLRTFQGLTGFFRLRQQIPLTTGVSFYDLPTIFPIEVGYTIRDRELVGAIQYHLYEPFSPGSWTGSEQFTLADLVDALSRARNRFLDDTGIVVTKKAAFVVPAGDGSVDLGSAAALNSDRIIDIIRAQWIDPSGRYYNVWKSDEIYADSIRAQWTLHPGIPYGFSVFGVPALHIQLTPPNAANGQLELEIIEAGLPLDPTANAGLGTLLSVPDNFAWVLKWGALTDLLSREGQAKDPLRASIAQKMYLTGIGMAMQTQIILHPRLDGRPVKPDTVFALDTTHQGWQGRATGSPLDLSILSHNLFAVRPAPDSRPHSLDTNMLVSATVPNLDADFAQIGREQLDLILDYSEFLASFKLGGGEAQIQTARLDAFMAACLSYNGKIAAAVRAAEATRIPERQQLEVPRRKMSRAAQNRI